MPQLPTSTKLSWLSILFLISLVACQKEKLTVRDVPFEELTASYYVIGDRTIEIPIDQVNSLILSRKEDALELADDPIFADLSEGSILVTELGTPHQDVILRKVLEINRNGQQISLKTELATIVEAFSEFYFNSQFEDVYSFKNGGTNLSAINSETSTQMFSSFNEDEGALITAWPVYEFDGQVSFEAIHPHTAYRYFYCNNDDACFNNINKTDVSPMNGYYDVVDQFFNNTLVDSLAKNGLYTITYSNFGLKKIGLAIGTKKEDGVSHLYDESTSVDALESLIRSSVKQQAQEDADDFLNLKYINTPATFWGLFTITMAIAPIFEYSLNAALFQSLDVTFPNRVDIVMGHINWNSTIPSAQVDFRITRDGKKESLSHLTKNGTVNTTLAVEGEMQGKMGLGVGAAISSGEANRAGVSIGAILEAALYIKVSGGFGARFSDVFNQQTGGNLEFFGRLCVDAGLAYDAYLFTDANLGTYIGDFFDYKFKIPKERFGIKNFSVFYAMDRYQDGVGVCAGFNACDSIMVEILNFGLDDEDQLGFELKIENSLLTGGTYKIKMKTSQGDFTLGTTYNYGEYYSMIITHGRDAIFSGVLDGTLQVEIEDTDQSCNKSFDKENYGFLISCTDPPYEDNQYDFGTTQTDLVGNQITYYDRNEAEAHCKEKGSKLIGEEALKDLLKDRHCVNPTGFLIENIDVTSKSNSNKAYIWIEQKENGDQVLAVDFEQKPGQGSIQTFRTERPSSSVRAMAVCVEK